MNLKDCCVLIPSLEPDEKLPNYVRALAAGGFGLILVVDDGSGEQYQPIFNEIASWKRCTVLHHPVNRGKGAALKTGFEYILSRTKYQGVITADSDGQHTVPDTQNLASLLTADEDELLLGSRDFSRKSKAVPPKSRAGNRITSCIFALLYGHWLPDTQTGLRALNRHMLKEQLTVTGDRFEYEMNQLIYCAAHHIKMRVVPIQTVYLNENKGSHFHPLRDSWRIYKLILTGFFKFISSSLIATLIDLGIFSVINGYVLQYLMSESKVEFFGEKLSARFLAATAVARLCSSVVNFMLNKNFVFRLQKSRGALLRYVVLVVCVLVVSSLSVSTISNWLNIAPNSFLNTLVKALVDTVLFFLNFRIQKCWVFAQKEKGAEKA